MSDKANPRISVNLTSEDFMLVGRVKVSIEKRIGIPIAFTQLVRMALVALAKQEKVKQ